MPGVLAAHRITKSFGAVSVLDGVSLALAPGDRVGVVGPNGIGKSSLLRVLAGLDEPDGGSVTRTPPSLAVGYLPQEPDTEPGETLLGYLARRTGVAAAEAEMDALADRLGAEPDLSDDYDDALEAPRVNACPVCHQPKRPHHACPTCHTYRGREVEPLRVQAP